MPSLKHIFDDFLYFGRADTAQSFKQALAAKLNENDRFVMKVMLCYWFTSLLISFYFDTYLLGFFGGGVITAIAWLGYRYFNGLPRRVIFCACLCLFSALFVIQQPGYVEPHFAFYASIYPLTRYKDIKPLMLFMVFTLAYYLTFTWLQSQGVSLWGLPVQLYTWGLWDALTFQLTAFIVSNMVFALIIRNHIVDFRTTQTLRLKLSDVRAGLDQSVIDQTAQLTHKTDDLKNMLNNLSQGLLMINPDHTIHRQYSDYLEQIFERRGLAAEPALELLFADSDASADAIATMTSVLDTCLGYDAMQFDLNRHLLLNECRLQLSAGVKVLRLDWSPIIDEDNEITQLLVSVRDMTVMKALRHQLSHTDHQLQLIGQILALSVEHFNQFISESKTLMTQNQQLIRSTPSRDKAVIDTLFLNIHTIKGMAKVYGLLLISQQLHDSENDYEQLSRQTDSPWLPDKLLAQLHQDLALLDEHEAINAKLGRTKQHLANDTWTTRTHTVSEQLGRLNSLLDEARDDHAQDRATPDQETLRQETQRMQQFFSLLGAQPLSAILAPVLQSVASLARELEKPEPEIIIQHNPVVICPSVSAGLKNAFSHIIRNAMDHGIETPWERLQKGKPESGMMQCCVHLDETRLNIVFSDDGGGLNLPLIKKRALKNGIIHTSEPLSPPDIANLIFCPGMSTAIGVSQISGRGVGLGAVKQLLKKYAGEVQIKLLSSDIDCVPFEICISLPATLASKNNSQAVVP